nr:integrase, catalytic region, zinc finger, CCHC-type, peptidase aspartic, catalytic [Tanacetum cinerariifolium]
MFNQSEDIQTTGFDTRPPMLNMTNFESWQQQIQLYYKGKDHGEYILQSIDEGPFKMGWCIDEIASADQCDAFDSDVDEAPTAQTMFKANLFSANLVYDEAGPSYDSDTLSEEALEITPIDQAHQFESSHSGNAIMDFVNELGYVEELHFVSRMVMNNLYQPWRAILSMINQFLTDKTSGKHNINQMYGSPFNMADDDYCLGNLKFVPKGEEDEVFGMQIPKELITNNIRSASYYNAYLEMVAKHDRKTAATEGGKKNSASKPISLESLQLLSNPSQCLPSNPNMHLLNSQSM